MKKLLLAATLLATLSVNAQNKTAQGEVPKIDSTEIPIISIKDLDKELAVFYTSKDLSPREYDLIRQAFSIVVQKAIEKINAVKPKQPKK